MFFLLSLLSVSFWGCEQRPNLGQPVILEENTNELTTQEQPSQDDQSQNNVLPSQPNENNLANGDSNDESTSHSGDESKSVGQNPKHLDKSDPDVVSQNSQDPVSNDSDSFTEKPFTLKSTDMGVSSTSEKEIQIKSADQISETNTTTAIAGNSWPIQLITITDTYPRRAILRLAEGKELTVQAGHLLEQEKLVILAIGKTHVSAAKIEAQGNETSIQQIDLQSLN